MPTSPLNRPLEIANFLDSHEWGAAQAQFFDGDFSSRRYARLTQAGGNTVLFMDADPDQKTPQFVQIARILRQLGLRAPEIYASEAEKGFVLLEDFGARNVGELIDANEPKLPFYLKAVEVLALLHRNFKKADAINSKLPEFTPSLFTSQAELFLDAYIPFSEDRAVSEDEREDFRGAWMAVLRPSEALPKSLLLRDFMPDNLMQLVSGELGVLDFQDAGIGSVAYDLASLCEEVRRDGGFALLPQIIAHYKSVSGTSVSETDLLRVCTVFSAQRHIRILGIVAQLALKKGRREKLIYIPRLMAHLKRILAEPYLHPVREWAQRFHGDLA